MEALKTNVLIWGMFMSSSMNAAIHHGPNYLANLEVYKNTNFEETQSLSSITQKLILEHSEEMLNVHTIESASSSWTRSVLSHDQVIQWTKAKVRVYSDSVLCLRKMYENKDAITKWEGQVEGLKMHPSYQELLRIDGAAIFQDFRHCRFFRKSRICENGTLNLSNLQTGSSSCRCATTSHGDLKTMKKNANQALSSFLSLYAKRFSPGQWSFLGPGSEKKWCSTHEYKPQGEWERVAEQMMITFAESRHPVFRSTSPLSRGVLKSKGGGKLSIHFCADETVFRTIISVKQLSIYGAVSELCEECKTCHVRTGRLVVAGQSNPLFVPSVVKTHILLTDDPAQEEDLLQRYQERVEKVSQQDRVIKFCTDAGFLTTVEVGQYFKTKDTEEFSQFTESVACREYTLPKDENSSEPKGWIRGNTKIGPVLEVTTCYLQGKYGVEN